MRSDGFRRRSVDDPARRRAAIGLIDLEITGRVVQVQIRQQRFDATGRGPVQSIGHEGELKMASLLFARLDLGQRTAAGCGSSTPAKGGYRAA